MTVKFWSATNGSQPTVLSHPIVCCDGVQHPTAILLLKLKIIFNLCRLSASAVRYSVSCAARSGTNPLAATFSRVGTKSVWESQAKKLTAKPLIGFFPIPRLAFRLRFIQLWFIDNLFDMVRNVPNAKRRSRRMVDAITWRAATNSAAMSSVGSVWPTGLSTDTTKPATNSKKAKRLKPLELDFSVTSTTGLVSITINRVLTLRRSNSLKWRPKWMSYSSETWHGLRFSSLTRRSPCFATVDRPLCTLILSHTIFRRAMNL